MSSVNGVHKVLRDEKNARRIVVITCLMSIASLWFRLSGIEFALVILCCGCVFVAEVFNTLFENTLDIIRPHHCDVIKILKDMSSGAVLVASCISFIVGMIIFVPKLFR